LFTSIEIIRENHCDADGQFNSNTALSLWLWMIRVIGVIAPRRLRADWRREWEAGLRRRQERLEE